MKKKVLFIIPALIAVAVGVVIAMRGGREQTQTAQTRPAVRVSPAQQSPVNPYQPPASTHSQMETEGRVPAHFKTPPSAGLLRPTLAPEQFSGPTREAYRAVKEIPQTIAQLPCYCYCDEGFGHKSLHSCFEDDHGAHCAVCVNEVLMAYQMEKQQGLTPAQIRERIIAYYSAANGSAPYEGTGKPETKKGTMLH
ncbi:MAG TPA: CYCXC family (seleno)protein [Pyrinomonadaceae bacterium]|jgi:hypothetical protein